MVDNISNVDFPIWGLLPKKETQVTSFLTKYPEYDGRGTIIAIFDSGVDPGAPGLEKTTDGKVKVLHRFDCSGCGDVNTSTIVEPVDNVIIGLTGRKLKIPADWKNPSNKYRVGVKNAYDLYPERVKDRVSTEYKEKEWDEHHRLTVAACNRELAEYESKHPGHANSDIDKLNKENLDNKLELLTNYDKKFHDSGPIYDCVLYHDGDKWLCCVDISQNGDLENCPLLGEYSVTHDYKPLTVFDNLNFSINVHDDGNILELVGLCSSHGTHVASIAAAYFPDSPELNGVAPGAQLISFTIGDGRLGSMETGTALVRAIIKLMELSKQHKIHVINMSYGEHAHFSDNGRIGELMNHVVNKYGVIWVASAGNHGPALSTIGTPPDISQETIIGVGAYVSPEMMIAAYSMRQKLPGMAFTWTSRGPCIDGGMGVTVCAPGGAVTSVPTCTLRYSQLMNGTSMASPHVAGAVSIMLSGLEQLNLNYSPYSVKRSMENTASFIQNIEVFAQGNGLLQVDKCFDYLVKYHDSQETNIRFQIQCGSGNSKGIYIRSKPTNQPTSYNISVEPHFLDADNVSNETKIKFNMKLVLTCNASYVSCPTHLDLSNTSRVFAVKVDPIDLPIGVHSTFVEAYDANCVKKGHIFKIPITVIQPQEITTSKYSIIHQSVLFQPNTIKRHFIVVPNFATWACLKLTTNDTNEAGRFVIHTMHILPKQSCKTLEINKAITVSSNTDSIICFQVRSNIVLEIVIAKYWANLGQMSLDYKISFYGIKPNQQSIMMHAADGIYPIEVTSLQGEEILPSMTLKNSVQVLKPNDGKILPLTKRDIVPPNRQIYELLLVYNFTLNKSTDVSPNIALLSDVLYESEFESQLWLLFDTNKQLLGCGDAYPSKYSIKLDKGDYIIRLQIRHEKKELLEKLTDMPMLLQQKLSSNISLDVYSSYSQAVIGGKKSNVVHGLNSMIVPYYIAPLPTDKVVSKSSNPAQYLTGYVTYCKDELGKKVDTYPVKYILYDTNSKKSSNGGANNNNNNNTANNNSSDKNKYEEIQEAIRDLQVQLLSKIDDVTTAETLYREFVKASPDHKHFHQAYLQSIDPLDLKHAYPPINDTKNLSFTKEKQDEIIAICDKIFDTLNDESILAYMAVKTDLRSDAAKIKSSMDQKKTMLIESLCRKGIALCRLNLLELSDKEEISKIWKNLCRFVDPTDSKSHSCVVYFALWHATVNKHYGRLLKYTQRLQDEKPCRELEERLIEICTLNNWHYIASHLQRSLPMKFPTTFRPF